MRRCKGVQNIFSKYYSGFIDDDVTELSFNLAFNNLKNFKQVLLFEDLENDLKSFVKNNNLEINTIPVFDYNSTKQNYTNDHYKKIAQFYNFYDLQLYQKVKKEILKK